MAATRTASRTTRKSKRVHPRTVNARSTLQAVQQRLSSLPPWLVVGVGLAAGAVAARMLAGPTLARWGRLLPGVIAATVPAWIDAASDRVRELKDGALRALP